MGQEFRSPVAGLVILVHVTVVISTGAHSSGCFTGAGLSASKVATQRAHKSALVVDRRPGTFHVDLSEASWVASQYGH